MEAFALGLGNDKAQELIHFHFILRYIPVVVNMFHLSSDSKPALIDGNIIHSNIIVGNLVDCRNDNPCAMDLLRRLMIRSSSISFVDMVNGCERSRLSVKI